MKLIKADNFWEIKIGDICITNNDISVRSNKEFYRKSSIKSIYLIYMKYILYDSKD